MAHDPFPCKTAVTKSDVRIAGIYRLKSAHGLHIYILMSLYSRNIQYDSYVELGLTCCPGGLFVRWGDIAAFPVLCRSGLEKYGMINEVGYWGKGQLYL